eukprot:scaffold7162_cov202-Prasinococcus_capsulatus_cf.AAC.1
MKTFLQSMCTLEYLSLTLLLAQSIMSTMGSTASAMPFLVKSLARQYLLVRGQALEVATLHGHQLVPASMLGYLSAIQDEDLIASLCQGKA